MLVALFAEFIGSFFFQLLGGSEQQAEYNGLLLTVCIVMTAKASGGMLNPAVSLGVLTAGAMPIVRCLLYCITQSAGALLASLIAAGVHVSIDGTDVTGPPGLDAWGDGHKGPGCQVPLPDEARGAVFVYELAGTFVLVSTVLASAVAKPGLGGLAPFAIGLSVMVSVGAAGSLTGGYFNPARFIGPALVFGCNLRLLWVYWLAQCCGGVLAGVVHRFIFVPYLEDSSAEKVLLSNAVELVAQESVRQDRREG